MKNRDRIVTSYTDPDRWTERERAYFDKDLCSRDVGVLYFGLTAHHLDTYARLSAEGADHDDPRAMTTRAYRKSLTTRRTDMPDRNRIVTPYTDPDRWTEEEKAHFDKGLCCWDVGVQYFGQTNNLCGNPSKPGASFGHCAEHEERLLENHWPDGSPRR